MTDIAPRPITLPPELEPPELVPNRPTPEGREMGRNIARLCDQADPLFRLRFPGAPERCKTCAFRLGTVPNGCVDTLMDATKALLEGVPFMCHESLDGGDPTRLCGGYAILQDAAGPNAEPVKLPWDYSHDPTVPELEPADTEPCPVRPAVGFCALCGELVQAGDPHAYAPPAHRARLACLACVVRGHELGAGG